jgi:hypothetical protein
MIPTPGPTRTPAVAVGLDLGMSGMTCDDYGEPEEMVVNKALETSIPGTDSSSSFSEHICTDVTSRRALLSSSSSVSIAVTASIIIADFANETGNDALVGDDANAIQNVDASAVISSVTETITNAVSTGSMATEMAAVASDIYATTNATNATTVDFSAVQTTSVSVSTVSPTAAPTPFPSTPGPTFEPSPSPTREPTTPSPTTTAMPTTLSPSASDVVNAAPMTLRGGSAFRTLLAMFAASAVLCTIV